MTGDASYRLDIKHPIDRDLTAFAPVHDDARVLNSQSRSSLGGPAHVIDQFANVGCHDQLLSRYVMKMQEAMRYYFFAA